MLRARRPRLWWSLPVVWVVGLTVVAFRPWSHVPPGDDQVDSGIELGWHEVRP